jgi:D-arabinose 1-dehydrogenase-like Zn-dependent alcohol dehydrogenase
LRAARLHVLGGPLVVEDVAAPVPGGGEVLVEVAACGIGLTVVHYCSAGLLGPGELPRIPGHEFVGTIRAVGDGVDPARVNETVVSYFYLTCGECRACLGAMDQLCERFAGTVGSAIDGGYAEFVVLPARNAIRLPNGIDAVAATTIPDAVATPVHVARRATISPGERVAVLGAGGGVGIHMVQVARAFGAEPFALDLDASKLAFLERELGVPGVASGVLAAQLLPERWDGQADVVVDFVGSAAGMQSAFAVLAPGGRLVCLTGHTGESVRSMSRELVFRQLAVLGSRYASRAEVLIAAELVRGERVRAVVSERVGLDGVQAVHEKLRRGKLLGRGALVLRPGM